MKLPGWLVVVLIAVAILAASGAALLTVTWLGPIGGERTASRAGESALAMAQIGPVYEAGTFTVNMGTNHFVRATIILEVDGREAVAALRERHPAVRDAIIGVLRTRTPAQLADNQGMQQLRDDIIAAVSPLLSEGTIQRVFFTDLITQ